MTVQIGERGEERVQKKEKPLTMRELKKIRADIGEKLGGPFRLFPKQNGDGWCLAIEKTRANGIGLRKNIFDISHPRKALEALNDAWPKNN